MYPLTTLCMDNIQIGGLDTACVGETKPFLPESQTPNEMLQELDHLSGDDAIPANALDHAMCHMTWKQRIDTCQRIETHYQDPEVSGPIILHDFSPLRQIITPIPNSDETTTTCKHKPCPICKESVVDNPVSLQCGHTYCHDCIFKWLGECDQRCPQCRTPAMTINDSDGNTSSAPTMIPRTDK